MSTEKRYKAYPEYKDSGVEWLEKIPSTWGESSLGFECSVKARLGWKGLKAEEYVNEGYAFLATPNIKTKDIDFINVNRITKDRYDESPEIMLEEGDVLVTKDGSTTGTTNIVRALPEPATVNSSIAVLRSFGEVESSYLYYFFVSDYTQHIINRMRGGMGVPHLFQADLRKFNILIPSRAEQLQIANFLDHEIAQMDALIEEQQSLIKLLQEKRQAVVSHAVTKGLNPDAPMKDSGVEWLGEVPEHWNAPKARYVAKLESGHTPSRNKPEYWKDCYIPWVSLSDVWQLRDGKQKYISKTKELISNLGLENSAARLLPQGTVILSRTASVGFSGIMNTEMATTQDFANWVCSDDLFPEFLLFCFWAMKGEFNRLMMGSTHKTIYMPDIKELYIPLPPLNEQRLINQYLNDHLPKYDALQDEARHAVERLQERRTALISAAVTGKIDVRDWQPPVQEALPL